MLGHGRYRGNFEAVWFETDCVCAKPCRLSDNRRFSVTNPHEKAETNQASPPSAVDKGVQRNRRDLARAAAKAQRRSPDSTTSSSEDQTRKSIPSTASSGDQAEARRSLTLAPWKLDHPYRTGLWALALPD
jgi:hypothetical protein